MTMHLPDVNVWFALAFKRHKHHVPAVTWLHTVSASCVFCRFTQAGILRLSSNPAAMEPATVTMAEACRAYDLFLADSNVVFVEEPQDIEAAWRSHTQGLLFSPKVSNDAYMAAFAGVSRSQVVTFDYGFSQYKNVRSTIFS